MLEDVEQELLKWFKKATRADVLAAFDTLVKFSQTSTELDCKFDDQLNSVKK